MAKAGTAYIVFRADFSELRRDIARATGDIQKLSTEEGEVKLKADSSDLKRELASAKGELRDFERSAKDADSSVGDMGNQFDVTRKRIIGLNSSIGGANSKFMLFRNTIRLIKWPAFIAGIGAASQGISALAAGAAGLSGALAPLSGLLASYPALLGAVGQAAGVVALAGIKDLTEAMAGNEEAMKRLTPEAQKFMKTLQKMEPQYAKLKATAQGNLFGGAQAGLQQALKNFPALHRVIEATADAMGDLARRAGSFLGRSGFGRDFERIGKGNARLLEQLGRAGLNFADALRHVMVVAQPLIRFLGNSVVQFSKFVEEEAKAGRESGRMAQFFRQTEQVFRQLVSIGGSVASVLREIGKAGAPLGRDILRSLESGADSLERWAESTRGRNTLEQYFKDAKPAIFEAGRLIRDATQAFFELGTTGGLADIIRQLRVELLPVLVEMTDATTKAFAPRLIELLVQFGKLMANFVGASGPLTLVVRGMTQFLRLVNALVESNPFIKNTVVTFVGLATAVKAFQFAKAISGFNALRSAILGTSAAASGGLLASTTSASYSKAGAALGLGLAKAVRVAIPAAFAAVGVGQAIGKAIEGDTKGAAIQGAGVAIGSALGAVIGSRFGATLQGALIGGGIGGVIGDLVSKLFDGGKVSKLQSRLAETAKAFAQSMKDVRIASRGIAESSQKVREAHQRQEEAAHKVARAERRYQQAVLAFGPNSRQARRALGQLTEAKEDQVRADKRAERAERLHGLQLKSSKQIYKSVLGAQNQRINALKDEERAARDELRSAVEANKGKKRTEEGTERVREAQQRLNRATKDLDDTQKKHNRTLIKVSQEIGPKFAKKWDQVSGQIIKTGKGLKDSVKDFEGVQRAVARTHKPLNNINSDTDKVGRSFGDMGKRVKDTSGVVLAGTGRIARVTKKDLGNAQKDASKASKKQKEDVTDNARNMTKQVLKALGLYTKETNKALKSLGVKQQVYQIKGGSGGGEGKQRGGLVELARGGFPALAFGGVPVPGSGSGDKVHLQALVEPGEQVFVLNRTASSALSWLENFNRRISRFGNGGFQQGGTIPHLQGGGFGNITTIRSAGHLVPYPGSTKADSRIVPNLRALQKRFKLTYGDIYAATGHAAGGEHPLGLAADIYPAAGGSWGLVTRLAHMAEPSQNAPVEPFRWVGYSGDANHGPFNHLHLSWEHGGGFPADWVKVFGGVGGGAEHLKRLEMSLDGKVSPINYAEGVKAEGGQKKRRGGRLQRLAKGGSILEYFLLREMAQSGMDTVWSAANAFIDKHSGFGGATAEWRGGNMSPAAIASLWREVNRGLGDPSLMARIAMAESSGDPRAVGHDPGGTTGLGLWQITTGFNDALIARLGGRDAMLTPEPNAQAAGVLFRGRGTQPWDASGPWPGQLGGLIPRLREGGGVKPQAPRGYEAPSFVDGMTGPLPRFLRQIKRGVKKAVEDAEKFISALINDDSEWGVPEPVDLGMRGIQRDSEMYAELAGVANTLTKEVPIPETKTVGEGIRTILGIASGPAGKGDEGFWLNRQLGSLLAFRTALYAADATIDKLMVSIRAMVAYAKTQLRIRKKFIEKLKKKLSDTRKKLKEAHAAAAKAEGTEEKRKAEANVKHLEAREAFFVKELKGENAVVAALEDPIQPGLDSELDVGVSSQGSIQSSLDEIQGISGSAGTIFDVRQALAAFNALKADLIAEGEKIEPETTEADDSELASLLQELLDEERRRNIVLEAQLPVFTDFFGSFQGGGVVPGPSGAVRPILAHGNEVVLTPEQAAAIGGTHVTVVVEDGAVDPDKISTVVSNHLRDEQSRARRMAGGRV